MATLEKAVEIATIAHAGHKDKAGAPYILHPLRIMMRMRTVDAQITAVLHDVVEDTKWTFQSLRECGFSEAVLTALDGVTRRADESYEAFVERASQNPIAREVKLADLEDNMNVLRLGTLNQESLERLSKYHRSWQRLQAS